MKHGIVGVMLIIAAAVGTAAADDIDDGRFNLIDVFQLEYAADPQISPDGTRIVYVRSFMDIMADQPRSNLWIVNIDGTNHRPLTTGNENDLSPRWSPDGTRLIYLSGGEHTAEVTCRWIDDVGGLSLGRPYSAGSYSVADNGAVAFTLSRPDFPADVALGGEGRKVARLTRLNEDLFGHKQLGAVEEIRFPSSFDGRKIQGWVVTPPDFDPAKKYPFILEIHGGPFANYGDRFSAEIGLYAAAGYVVLYLNPRGSTSYGEEFGNLIHHNYPSQLIAKVAHIPTWFEAHRALED